MRYAFPSNTFTNHGLGNELFPIAKAYIAAQELGIEFLPPSWARNRRNYRRFFGNARGDWIRLAYLKRTRPVFHLSEEEYFETGKTDFADAVRVFADKYDLASRKSYVLTTHGMWGLFYPVRRARQFITSFLLNTRFTLSNLYAFEAERNERKLTVAVNVRLTDFKAADDADDANNLVNTRLPFDWYTGVCRALRQEFGKSIEFYLVTDGTPQELKSFIDEFKPLTHFHRQNCDISNLIIMASRCDLVICSVSTYSLWASFLSQSPYVWYSEQLTSSESGLRLEWSQWVDGLTPMFVGRPDVPTESRTAISRGVPVGRDCLIPPWLFEHLACLEEVKSPAVDLVLGGTVPVS